LAFAAGTREEAGRTLFSLLDERKWKVRDATCVICFLL
jgi:hypothetical protein